MKHINFILLVLIVMITLLCSCQKELSCEGPECMGIYEDGKAVYTFLQDNGNCTNAAIYGSYFKEVLLSDSNYVYIKLNITKKGVYTINTDTLNGFYFSNKGIFTDTGIVTVNLKSVGTPVAAGNYSFSTGKASGCNFTIKVDTVLFVEKYYYDVTIDGVRYQQTVGGNIKVFNYLGPDPSNVIVISQIGDGTLVHHLDGFSYASGFGIGKAFIRASDITTANLQNYFALGSYNYFNQSPGILIAWDDLNEPAYAWRTYNFPYTQTSSNFSITSVEVYSDAYGRPIAKVKAEFNCILYNGRGQSKVLTNGKFYGEFANINR